MAGRNLGRWIGASVALVFLALLCAAMVDSSQVSLTLAARLKLAVTRAPIQELAVLAPTHAPIPAALDLVAEVRPVDASSPAHDTATDHTLRHFGFSVFPAGVVAVPRSFRRDGGAYDVLIHFHGSPQIVRESAELAGLNALVVAMNIGEGSTTNARPYRYPSAYQDLLAYIQIAAHERGLDSPRLRRVALSSWSGGYGAIKSLLRRGPLPHLDAVLILDGMHFDYFADDSRNAGKPNLAQLKPFLPAAREAAAGRLLFSLTHSDYDPKGYVGAGAAAQHLLSAVASSAPMSHDPLGKELKRRVPSAGSFVKRRIQQALVPQTNDRRGQLHARGYKGEGWAHHRAHLLQMGVTVLPELAARWSAGSANEPASNL